MNLDSVKIWLLHWPRAVLAVKLLLTRKPAYPVVEAPLNGITVTHRVHATIYRAPVFELKEGSKDSYYTAQRIYVPGVVSTTAYFAPEIQDIAEAKAAIAEMIGMRSLWISIIDEDLALCAGVCAYPGDVVEYRESLA